MKPKLYEVAQRAKVSEATVSRVLNQRPGVAEATRLRVLDVLNQLGYNFGPDRVRKLGTTVGIITPEFDNPIFPLIAQTIESKLARHGLLSMIGPATPTTAHERDYIHHFLRMGARAVVIVNGSYARRSTGYAAYERLLTDGIAVVLVNGVTQPCPIPAVTVDMVGAAQSAIRHLVHLGHRRIGCIPGDLDYAPPQDLVAGYWQALKEAAITLDDELVVEGLFTIEGGRCAAEELFDKGATALIAISDIMALGAVASAQGQGLGVPADVSIIGFDGTPLLAMYNPTLTTLRQPVDRMAQTVATMVAGQLRGDRQTTQLFEAELIAGATAGLAPALAR
ncbi:MAG: LacI family DNA-binding transcriptional regulator [Acidimicrobiia bacterium]